MTFQEIRAMQLDHELQFREAKRRAERLRGIKPGGQISTADEHEKEAANSGHVASCCGSPNNPKVNG